MKRPLHLILAAIALAGCGEQATLPSTATVYGDLVFEDSTPAPNIAVLVEGTGLTAVSNERGRFIINAVPAVDEISIGKVHVVRGEGTRDGVPVGFLVDHFKVKGQQSYSIGRVLVEPMGSIMGSVELEGSTDHSGAVIGLEGTSLTAISLADGSYRLNRVPVHEGYRVECRREGFLPMGLDRMLVDGKMRPITVPSGQTIDLARAVMHRAPVD